MREVVISERFSLAKHQQGMFDPFFHFNTGDRWTLVASNSGTASIKDAHGGVLEIEASDGTAADNDESYVHSTNEILLFEEDKPFELGSRLKFEEPDADGANVIFGCMNGVAADALGDNGGGPPGDYSGAVIYKVDGESLWRFETSLGTDQMTTVLNVPTPDGANDWHTLLIRCRFRSAATVEISPWIDPAGGADLKQALDSQGRKVKHFIELGSPTEMAVLMGVKAGTADAHTLDVDWVGLDVLN